MKLLLVLLSTMSVLACSDSGRAEEIQDIRREAEISVRLFTPAEKFEIEVMEIKGDFAKAKLIPLEAIEQGNVYLKKVNGQWVGVMVSGSVDPETCERENLPSEICP